MEYLSPQGVLLPRVYGTPISRLWLGLQGPLAWQATPSWTVCGLACHRLYPWLQGTLPMVLSAAWPGSDQRPWSNAPATGPVEFAGLPQCVRPLGCGLLCPCRSAALGAHARAASGAPSPFFTGVRDPCVPCAVSLATWRLFTGVRIVFGRRVVLAIWWGPPLFLCFCFYFCVSVFWKREETRKRGAQTVGVLCLRARQ